MGSTQINKPIDASSEATVAKILEWAYSTENFLEMRTTFDTHKAAPGAHIFLDKHGIIPSDIQEFVITLNLDQGIDDDNVYDLMTPDDTPGITTTKTPYQAKFNIRGLGGRIVMTASQVATLMNLGAKVGMGQRIIKDKNADAGQKESARNIINRTLLHIRAEGGLRELMDVTMRRIEKVWFAKGTTVSDAYSLNHVSLRNIVSYSGVSTNFGGVSLANSNWRKVPLWMGATNSSGVHATHPAILSETGLQIYTPSTGTLGRAYAVDAHLLITQCQLQRALYPDVTIVHPKTYIAMMKYYGPNAATKFRDVKDKVPITKTDADMMKNSTGGFEIGYNEALWWNGTRIVPSYAVTENEVWVVDSRYIMPVGYDASQAQWMGVKAYDADKFLEIEGKSKMFKVIASTNKTTAPTGVGKGLTVQTEGFFSLKAVRPEAVAVFYADFTAA